MAQYGLDRETHERIAQQLFEAEQSVVSIPPISKEYPKLTMDDAYAIQQEGLKLRLASGVRVIGHKVGITSQGMMEMLDCDSPDYGYLLAHTQLPAGGTCARSELHAPIIEGELAFILGKDLKQSPVTTEDVIEATDYIAPCFEVCDSRYGDWNLTVADIISDNAAASRFMLGLSTRTIRDISPESIGMTMKKNGQFLASASGAEVMGSPVNSVVWLANKLLEYGDCLQAGDIVLSGSFMAADRAEAGDTYTIMLQGFYPLTIVFV